jgi:uncharacterized RDD family membrane protein YckC
VSDTPQGPGWWQASDGKYYPPEQASTFPAPGAGGGVPAGGFGATGQLASFGERAIGLLIDVAMIFAFFVVGFIITLVFSAISSTLGALVGLVLYIAYAGAGLYLGFLVGQKGASPGMAITGLRCVSEDTGQIIGGGMGVIRSLAGIINSIICYVGWLFPLWDPKKQTVSDKLVKTLVYAGQPKQSFSLDLFKP